MGIVETNKWFEQRANDHAHLFEKLRSFSAGSDPVDFYLHLVKYGMHRRMDGVEEIVKQMKEKKIWEMVGRDFQQLKQKWNGPDVPILIFPADWTNAKLHREFNGKSGLAFKDKLFLFLLPHHTKEEIGAVLTHEYNHVCRLHYDPKDEKDYTIIDSIVLEGLAENAVYERFGERHVAKWTTYYNETQLRSFWQKWIVPNKKVKKDHPLYRSLMYGSFFYPKMLGYAVGYAIVKERLKEKKMNELFTMKSEEICENHL
jgi:uncharacterized protein YjaZ